MTSEYVFFFHREDLDVQTLPKSRQGRPPLEEASVPVMFLSLGPLGDKPRLP